MESKPQHFSSSEVFRASTCVLLLSSPKLVLTVVAVDFIVWSLVIELPCKFAEHVRWEQFAFSTVPPDACTVWPTHVLAWPLQTWIHLVATLIVVTRVIYARLSPEDAMKEVIDIRSFAFLEVLCRMAVVTSPFVLAAVLGPVVLINYAIDLIHLVQPFVPMVIVDTQRHTIILVALVAGVLVGVGRILGPWFLVVPLAAVEARGISAFSESTRYTSHSPKRIWIIYTVHLWIAMLALGLAWPLSYTSPSASLADYLPLARVLTTCLVWHCALSAECYAVLKKLTPQRVQAK